MKLLPSTIKWVDIHDPYLLLERVGERIGKHLNSKTYIDVMESTGGHESKHCHLTFLINVDADLYMMYSTAKRITISKLNELWLVTVPLYDLYMSKDRNTRFLFEDFRDMAEKYYIKYVQSSAFRTKDTHFGFAVITLINNFKDVRNYVELSDEVYEAVRHKHTYMTANFQCSRYQYLEILETDLFISTKYDMIAPELVFADIDTSKHPRIESLSRKFLDIASKLYNDMQDAGYNRYACESILPGSIYCDTYITTTIQQWYDLLEHNQDYSQDTILTELFYSLVPPWVTK